MASKRLVKPRVTSREVLFEDPDPNSRFHNAAFASLVGCRDGSVLLAHRVGRKKNSADGTQFLWRYRDGNWRQVDFPFERDRPPLRELRTAALSHLDNGSLAMLLTWIDHRDTDSPIANPETEGLLPVSIGWSTSRDCGETWTPLTTIPVHPLDQACGNGPIVQGRDGSWIAAFEVYKHFDDPSPWSSRAAVVCSHDLGTSWAPPVIVAEDPSFQTCYWDLHLRTLRCRTILGTGWFDHRSRPGESGTYWVKSEDGITWSAPCPTGIEGQYTEVLELPDGRLVVCYVTRSVRPAIRVRVVESDPRLWPAAEEHIIYEQDLDDIRATRGAGFGDYLQGMSRWSFGWPSMFLLSEGTLLVAYYSGWGDFSAVRLAEVSLYS